MTWIPVEGKREPNLMNKVFRKQQQTGKSLDSIVILLGCGPNSGISRLIDFDVDHIGAATDRTVLDILLSGPLRYIERSDDFFAAGIADIAGFIFHPRHPLGANESVGRSLI